jgi:hypothetical protein
MKCIRAGQDVLPARIFFAKSPSTATLRDAAAQKKPRRRRGFFRQSLDDEASMAKP